MISSLGAGQALVAVPPMPLWRQHQVGERSGNVRLDIERHFVMPGGGQANDLEGDPNPYWDGGPYGFNNNGEFMLGDAAVSSGSTMPPVRLTANVVSSIGPTVTMALGAGAGAYLMPQHRAVGTVVGALVGGILGIIFSPG